MMCMLCMILVGQWVGDDPWWLNVKNDDVYAIESLYGTNDVWLLKIITISSMCLWCL